MEERKGKGGLVVPGVFSEAAATGVAKLLAGVLVRVRRDARRRMETHKIKAAEAVLLTCRGSSQQLVVASRDAARSQQQSHYQEYPGTQEA